MAGVIATIYDLYDGTTCNGGSGECLNDYNMDLCPKKSLIDGIAQSAWDEGVDITINGSYSANQLVKLDDIDFAEVPDSVISYVCLENFVVSINSYDKSKRELADSSNWEFYIDGYECLSNSGAVFLEFDSNNNPASCDMEETIKLFPTTNTNGQSFVNAVSGQSFPIRFNKIKDITNANFVCFDSLKNINIYCKASNMQGLVGKSCEFDCVIAKDSNGNYYILIQLFITD